MTEKTLSITAIQRALTTLSDPDVSTAVDLASTPLVAKDIIQSLPGVKELRESGLEARKAVLALLRREETLEDENLSAIGIYILESYPSNEVKLALAKQISAKRFRGINAQLAAETFLNAAGIEFLSRDAIAVALREARKLYPVKVGRNAKGKKTEASDSKIARKRRAVATHKRQLAAKK